MDYRDEQICPSCGETLMHSEDSGGETFQCPEMDCQQFYEANEILEEPTT